MTPGGERKGDVLGSAHRSSVWRVVALPGVAVLAAALVVACGTGRTASRTPSAGPSGSPTRCAPLPLVNATAALFTRASDRLILPYREYRRAGSWSLADATDTMAVFLENGRAHPRLWLMDLTSGRARLALPGAISGRAGFWLGTVQVSDDWVVWEEVGPGDDLTERVEWRLYAARRRQSMLGLEQPRLVVSGRRSPRPLFDVCGSRLVWIATAVSSGGTGRSRLLMEELDSGRREVLYRPAGTLETVSFSGARLLVSEPSSGVGMSTCLLVFSQSGELLNSFDAGDASGLSHWPAWRDGRLAWTPFATGDAAYPGLYVRDPAGSTSTDGGSAVDPCFAGGYLFYQARRPGGGAGSSVLEVRALRLSDGVSLVLESGRPDDNTWWRGVVGPTDLRRTYVAYLDRALLARRAAERYTLIRVYDAR